MKIGFVLPHFYPYVGGGEKLFFDIAKELVKRGHIVRVVTGDTGTGLTGVHEIEGITVEYCPWKEMFGHPFPKRKDVEDIIRWCDIAHTSTYTTAPVVSKLARIYQKPTVMTIHEIRGNKWYWADDFIRASIYNLVEQYTCRQKFSVYHAVSDATKADIERFLGKKNVVRIYNANEMNPSIADMNFSLKSYFGLKDTDRTFLYYGRPGKTKGIYVYSKAIQKLTSKDDFPEDVKFCFILGSEPAALRKAFINNMKKLGLLDKSVLVKNSLKREELAAAIMQAECVVVPSLTEGFGFSALEACQMGTNLIYSDGGALPEVAYGKCRSFTNRSSDDLAKKLQGVIEYKMDAYEQVAVKNFTYEEQIDGIENLYKDLLKK